MACLFGKKRSPFWSIRVIYGLILFGVTFGSAQIVPAATFSVTDCLKVSDNQHYLVDAKTGAPVFILADTAWNLGALKLEEIETYLHSRENHGINAIMFALNFSPQASETNAYGQTAYIGADKTE